MEAHLRRSRADNSTAIGNVRESPAPGAQPLRDLKSQRTETRSCDRTILELPAALRSRMLGFEGEVLRCRSLEQLREREMPRGGDKIGARPSRLSDLVPDLLDELARELAAEDRADLIPQLQDLAVESRCGCQQPDCATIYVAGGTSPRTDDQKRDRGPHWRDTVAIDAHSGHIAVDTDPYDCISAVEILNGPDIRERLRSVKWRT